MEAKELRIGNYVQEPDGTSWRITGIMDKRVLVSDNDDNETGFNLYRIEPIPLKADLLEKCGLKVGESDTSIEIFQNSVRDGSGRYDGFMFIIGGTDVRKMPPKRKLTIVVRHLHQLQNLYYSLTGSELVVNLNQ